MAGARADERKRLPVRGDGGHGTRAARAVAQSTIDVVAPTQQLTRRRNPAGVLSAGTDRAKHFLRRDRVRNVAIVLRLVAQLSLLVLAPAVDATAGREPARVSVARDDGTEREIGLHRKGLGREILHRVAYLTRESVAPAKRFVRARHTTGVRAARGERLKALIAGSRSHDHRLVAIAA